MSAVTSVVKYKVKAVGQNTKCATKIGGHDGHVRIRNGHTSTPI